MSSSVRRDCCADLEYNMEHNAGADGSKMIDHLLRLVGAHLMVWGHLKVLVHIRTYLLLFLLAFCIALEQ